MISASYPEPLCDVLAQLTALAHPDHPKDAVWLANGTPLSDAIPVKTDAGLLLTTSGAKAKSFETDPSDETLAAVLGYAEPKWSITGPPVVVQACNADGAVITEMVASDHKLAAAIVTAGKYGAVHVTTLPGALARRAQLCAERR